MNSGLIGISGLAGSGKDTAGDFLVRNHGYIKIAFADPLKRIVRDIFDFSDEQLWGASAKRNEPDPRYPRPDGTLLTPRMALQQLGTEFGRNCYPNVWIDYALRLKDTALASPHSFLYDKKLGLYPAATRTNPINGVVISDVRFKNEIEALKKNGAILIRLKRDRAGLEGNAALHSSEAEQLSIPDSEFDVVIDNNLDHEYLFDRLSKIV